MGLVDLSKSIYMGGQVAWVSHVVGGAFFGFGMTLASGCGSKTLIRIGGGNLKSLIVLIVMGIAAYMTLKGVFASWRAAGLDPWRIDFASFGGKTSDLPSLVGGAGLGATARWLVPALVAGAVAAFAFANRDFRESREMIVGGVIVGAVVVAGWYASGHLGYLAEDPATLEEKFVATNSAARRSFSFVAPADLLELLMMWTTRVLTFGIAASRMIAGSPPTRWSRSRSAGRASRARRTSATLVGATMMGFGSVTALSCTTRQGISAMSTLAVNSILTLLAIIGGACWPSATRWRLERMA
jgi:hypothetical protein